MQERSFHKYFMVYPYSIYLSYHHHSSLYLSTSIYGDKSENMDNKAVNDGDKPNLYN